MGLTRWLLSFFRNRPDAPPPHKWEPTGWKFNPGMDAPYDESRAVAAVRRAKRRTARGRALSKPKPAASNVVSIQRRRAQ